MNTKLKVLAFALTLFLMMASCGSDDSTPIIDQNLFGTWTLDATILINCPNPDDNDVTDAACDGDNCTRLVLTSDNRYERRVTQGGQEQVTEQGRLQVEESNLFLYPDNTTGGQSFPYALNTNTLLLTNSSFICRPTFRYTKQ